MFLGVRAKCEVPLGGCVHPLGDWTPALPPAPTAAVASQLPALLLGVQCALNKLRGSHHVGRLAQGPGPPP